MKDSKERKLPQRARYRWKHAISSRCRSTNIISYLISAGSDLNTYSVQGNYSLTLAVRCGKNDIVGLLMKSELVSNKAQIGALRAAIVAGHVGTTSLLLRLGAPMNIVEKGNPMNFASWEGREEIVILLLHYGASLTSFTDTRNTVLIWRVNQGT